MSKIYLIWTKSAGRYEVEAVTTDYNEAKTLKDLFSQDSDAWIDERDTDLFLNAEKPQRAYRVVYENGVFTPHHLPATADTLSISEAEYFYHLHSWDLDGPLYIDIQADSESEAADKAKKRWEHLLKERAVQLAKDGYHPDDADDIQTDYDLSDGEMKSLLPILEDVWDRIAYGSDAH